MSTIGRPFDIRIDQADDVMARMGVQSNALRLLSLVDNVERLAPVTYPSDSDSEGSSFLYKMQSDDDPKKPLGKKTRKQYSVNAKSLQKERTIWVFILSILLVCSLLFAMLTVSSVMKRRRLENDSVETQKNAALFMEDELKMEINNMSSVVTEGRDKYPASVNVSTVQAVATSNVSTTVQTPEPTVTRSPGLERNLTTASVVKTTSTLTTTAMLESLPTTVTAAQPSTLTPVQTPSVGVYVNSYNAKLTTDVDASLLRGDVTMNLMISNATSILVMNLDNGHVTHVFMRHVHNVAKIDATFTRDDIRGTVAIHFDNQLNPDEKYAMRVRFERQIRPSASGCPSLDGNGCTLLPYFGDAKQRSIFEISAEYPAACTAISTMPIKVQVPISSFTTFTQFEASPFIPLSALSLELFKLKNSIVMKSSKGSQIGLFFHEDVDMERTTFAKQFIPAVVDSMESFMGTDLPLSKIDFYTLSRSSVAQQKVRFGVVGFPEKILVPEKSAWSENDQEASARMVANAVAKQWFGGSVTFNKNTWLEGALTTLVGGAVVNKLYPSLREGTLDRLRMLSLLEEIELKTLTRIEEKEQKGHFVLEMIGQYFGMDVIFNPIKDLHSSHKFASINENLLWKNMSQLTHISCSAIMVSWVEQEGYPVLRISRESSSTSQLVIQQLTMFKDRKGATELEPVSLPTTISYEDDTIGESPAQRVIVNQLQAKVKAQYANGWINANSNLEGFFELTYNADNWLLLISQLQSNHKLISATGRANIIHNAFAMGRKNMLDITVAMATICYIPKEVDYIAMATAIESLTVLDLLYDKSSMKVVKDFKNALMKPTAERLGWKQITEYSDRYLQILMLKESLVGGQAAIVREGMSIFQQLSLANAAIKFKYLPARLRQSAYNAGIIHRSSNNFDIIWAVFVNTDNGDIRTMLTKALCQTKRSREIQKMLNFTMTNEGPLVFQILEELISNPHSKHMVLQFMLDNLDYYETRSSSMTDRLFQMLARKIGHPDDLEKITNFVKTLPTTTTSVRFSSVITTVTANVAFVRANDGYLVDWMGGFMRGACRVKEWKTLG